MKIFNKNLEDYSKEPDETKLFIAAIKKFDLINWGSSVLVYYKMPKEMIKNLDKITDDEFVEYENKIKDKLENSKKFGSPAVEVAIDPECPLDEIEHQHVSLSYNGPDKINELPKTVYSEMDGYDLTLQAFNIVFGDFSGDNFIIYHINPRTKIAVIDHKCRGVSSEIVRKAEYFLLKQRIKILDDINNPKDGYEDLNIR